jgi:hypothetical protein
VLRGLELRSETIGGRSRPALTTFLAVAGQFATKVVKPGFRVIG